MANYGHITKPANPEAVRGGYKNVILFAHRDDVTTWAKPVFDEATPGSAYTISTAHTFGVNSGYKSWASKTKSVVAKATTIGDEGSGLLQYTFEGVILGDSASTQEQIARMLNDDLVFWVKDSNCLINDSYLQFGDECDAPTIKAEFDSMNSDGTKNWKITGTITSKRFFYTATLQKAA